MVKGSHRPRRSRQLRPLGIVVLAFAMVASLIAVGAGSVAAQSSQSALGVKSRTSTSAVLQWTAPAGSSNFEVFVDGRYRTSTNSRTFRVTGLSPSTTHRFVVNGWREGKKFKVGNAQVTTPSPYVLEMGPGDAPGDDPNDFADPDRNGDDLNAHNQIQDIKQQEGKFSLNLGILSVSVVPNLDGTFTTSITVGYTYKGSKTGTPIGMSVTVEGTGPLVGETRDNKTSGAIGIGVIGVEGTHFHNKAGLMRARLHIEIEADKNSRFSNGRNKVVVQRTVTVKNQRSGNWVPSRGNFRCPSNGYLYYSNGTNGYLHHTKGKPVPCPAVSSSMRFRSTQTPASGSGTPKPPSNVGWIPPTGNFICPSNGLRYYSNGRNAYLHHIRGIPVRCPNVSSSMRFDGASG